MRIACIARCIGVAVFAASLQAGAQPPEGKGKPAHAGASPFVRFPVPQRAVGVMRNSQGTAAGQNAAPAAQSAQRPAGAKPVELALGTGGFPPSEKKAPLVECGAR